MSEIRVYEAILPEDKRDLNDISLKEKALSIWQDLRRKYPEEDLYRERVETEISNIEKVRAYLKRNQ